MNGNNTKKILLFGAGAVILYLAFRYIRFTNRLQVDLQKIRFGGSLTMPEIFVTLAMYNPTGLNVNLTQVDGWLFFQNRKLATVFSNQPVNIQAGKMVTLDLKLVSSITDLFPLIQNVFSAGGNSEFYFQGNLTVDGVTIPVRSNLGA